MKANAGTKPISRARRRRLLLSLLLPPLSLAACELLLRVAGFEYRPEPVRVFFGERGDRFRAVTERDPELLWVLRRSARTPVADYEVVTNSLGTRGGLPVGPPGRDEIRVVCAGDSTAFGNFTSYPRELERILREALSDRDVRVVNGGVLGYTSVQAVRLLERDLLDLGPEIVTFCAGFNDSWNVPRGQSDVERMENNAGFAARASRVLLRLRTAQWIRRVVDRSEQPRAPASPREIEDPVPRVSFEEYESAVRRFIETCRLRGATPIGITQPHAFPSGGALEAGLRARREDHDRRNDILRHVCAELEAPCLDLALAMRDHDPAEIFNDPYPGRDSVHMNPVGCRAFAEEIAAFLFQKLAGPGAPPELPRYRARCSRITGETIDLDGDGIDEVALCGVFDDEPRLAVVEPRSGASEVRPLGLDRPVAPLRLAWLPQLRALVVIEPGEDGESRARFFDCRGREALPAMTLKTPAGALPEVRAVDFNSDGRPSSCVTFGFAGPPTVLLLGPDFRPDPIRPFVPVPDGAGVLSYAGRLGAPGEECLLLGSGGGRPWGRRVTRDAIEALSPPYLRMRVQPVQYLCGRFAENDALDRLAVLRQPALAFCTEGGEGFRSVSFPFRAYRLDPKQPDLGMARVDPGGGEAPYLVVGALLADGVWLVRVDGGKGIGIPERLDG